MEDGKRKKQKVSFWIEADLKDEVDKCRKVNRRTFAAELNHAIDFYLKHKDRIENKTDLQKQVEKKKKPGIPGL